MKNVFFFLCCLTQVSWAFCMDWKKLPLCLYDYDMPVPAESLVPRFILDETPTYATMGPHEVLRNFEAIRCEVIHAKRRGCLTLQARLHFLRELRVLVAIIDDHIRKYIQIFNDFLINLSIKEKMVRRDLALMESDSLSPCWRLFLFGHFMQILQAIRATRENVRREIPFTEKFLYELGKILRDFLRVHLQGIVYHLEPHLGRRVPIRSLRRLSALLQTVVPSVTPVRRALMPTVFGRTEAMLRARL